MFPFYLQNKHMLLYQCLVWLVCCLIGRVFKLTETVIVNQQFEWFLFWKLHPPLPPPPCLVWLICHLFAHVAGVDWNTHQPHDEGGGHQGLLRLGPRAQQRHSGGRGQHLHVGLFPGETWPTVHFVRCWLCNNSSITSCNQIPVHPGIIQEMIYSCFSCAPLAPLGFGSWYLHVLSHQIHEW